MSQNKDLKSKPKKGWFSPLRFGDVVKLVKDYSLVQDDGTRIAIRQENSDKENEYGLILTDIFPEESLTVYSIPETVNKIVVENAVVLAIKLLAEKKKCIDRIKNTKYSYYCAYLRDSKDVIITRKDMSRQIGKYRGDSKFSNAFKSKKVHCNETEICRVEMNRILEE